MTACTEHCDRCDEPTPRALPSWRCPCCADGTHVIERVLSGLRTFTWPRPVAEVDDDAQRAPQRARGGFRPSAADSRHPWRREPACLPRARV